MLPDTPSPDTSPTPPVAHLDERRGRLLGAVQLVRRHSEATGSPRAVLLALATYADPSGANARPSIPTLCRETGFSRSTVIRGLAALVDAGEIELVSRGSGRTPSVYRVTLSPPVDNPVDDARPDDRTQTRAVSPRHPSGITVTRQGCHGDTQPRNTDLDREGVRWVDHCPAHALVEDPPPCQRCRRTREANVAARSAAARTIAAERHLERARLAREESLRDKASRVPPPASFREALRRGRQDPS